MFAFLPPSSHPIFAGASCKVLESGNVLGVTQHTHTRGEREREEEKRRKIPILNHIKNLGSDKKSHVVHTDPNQHFIPPAIERFVVISIDLASRKTPHTSRQQTITQHQQGGKKILASS